MNIFLFYLASVKPLSDAWVAVISIFMGIIIVYVIVKVKQVDAAHERERKEYNVEQDYLCKAKDYLNNKEYHKCIEYYSKLINFKASNSKNSTFFNNRGVAYHGTKQLQKALNDYNTAILLDPSAICYYENRAMLFEELKDFKKAKSDWESALRLENEDPTKWSLNIKIHLMSNILDVTFFDIDLLTTKLINTQKGVNHYICVSPNYITGNERLDKFLSNLHNQYNGSLNCYSERSSSIGSWERYEKLIAINAQENVMNNINNNINDDNSF